MRTILLFCVFLIVLFTNTKAQNNLIIDSLPWAPQGATWIYITSPLMTIKYTHDSIVAGQDVKVFKFYGQRNDSSFYPVPRPYISFEGEEYLYNSNDSVFFYDQGLEEFVFLYDFNAQEGDTWNYKTSYLDCRSNPSLNNTTLVGNIINSEATININSLYYSVSTSIPDNMYFNRIIPNIGSTAWFFPSYNIDSCQYGSSKYLPRDLSILACYTDNIRGRLIHAGTGSYTDFDTTCTSMINRVNDFIVSVEEPTLSDNKNDKFSIYPNPAHSALNIYSNGIAMQEIMIYDAVGRLVIHDKSRNQSIDINSLMSGLYIINIVDEYKQVSAFKFVKE